MFRKVVALSACALLLTGAVFAARSVAPVRPLGSDNVLEHFPGAEELRLEEVTGAPAWIHGQLGTLARGDIATAAEVFVRERAAALQLGRHDDLRVVRVEQDELGMRHVRLQQYHRGLPVDGGDIYLHVDAAAVVRTVNGHLGAAIEQLPVPSIDRVGAVAFFAERMKAASVDLRSGVDLVYYTRADEPAYLAWRFEAQWSDGDGTYLDRVYVDADDGTVLDRQSLIWVALSRKIYSANNGTSLPGTLVISEGGSSSDVTAQAAYTNAGTTYNYFKTRFNRDSYNNSGAQLVATVHYSSGYNNAYWNGSQMVYGDGDGSTFGPFARAFDVVAHELAHAVTEYTADLNYSYESGALNEAMSDVFAAGAEMYRDGSLNTDTWKIGEDCYTPATAGDALRYMNNPTTDGSSYDYYPERYTGSQDNGGVHLNSGIANLAFVLLTQGGTHPRGKTSINVPAIGMAKAEQIFYRALASYMTSTTNFEGARNATAQAATDLYGATEANAVHQAWSAVGVPGGPVSVTTLTNGQTVANLSGSTGSWKHYKLTVPAGQTSLVIKTFNGSGDCDLYVKRGAQPTSSSYDYRPYLSGNTETVTVSNPAAGDWYIGLYAYSTYSAMSLQGTYAGSSGGGVTALSNGVAVTNLSGAASSEVFYKIAVPTGQASLEIKTWGGTGDCDLYVKRGSQPTTSTYDYRPYLSGNTETVTVTSPAAGDWYVMLRAYSAYSGMSLKATYAASGGGGGTTMNESESNNTTSSADLIASSPMEVTGYIGTSSDVDYFKLTLPGYKTVTLDMTVPSGKDYDVKLYNTSGTTLATGQAGTGLPEHVTYYNNSSTSRVIYIKVYPYSGYSSTAAYKLSVSW